MYRDVDFSHDMALAYHPFVYFKILTVAVKMNSAELVYYQLVYYQLVYHEERNSLVI